MFVGSRNYCNLLDFREQCDEQYRWEFCKRQETLGRKEGRENVGESWMVILTKCRVAKIEMSETSISLLLIPPLQRLCQDEILEIDGFAMERNVQQRH